MSVIEEKKALRTFIRKKERTLAPAYKAESSEAICRHLLALDEYKTPRSSSPLPAPRKRSTPLSL